MRHLKTLERIKTNLAYQKENSMPTEWEMEHLQGYVEGLFTFAKFKAGDTVKIAKDYPISSEENWGWMSYRHLFKKGKKAVVNSVDYYNGRFQYEIKFKENSWIDDKDVVHPIEGTNHHNFNISEGWLGK